MSDLRPSLTYTEAELVQGLKARDEKVFSYVYDHYSPALYGVALKVLNDETTAVDVLQEIFLKIWRGIERYDAEKGRLFTWMLNIARNQAIDKTRSKEFSKGKKTDDIDNLVNKVDRDEYVEQKVDVIGLQELLQLLPEDQRFVIDQHYLKGYTQAEMAEEFNLPLGTVKTRMRLAMIELRNLLKIT